MKTKNMLTLSIITLLSLSFFMAYMPKIFGDNVGYPIVQTCVGFGQDTSVSGSGTCTFPHNVDPGDFVIISWGCYAFYLGCNWAFTDSQGNIVQGSVNTGTSNQEQPSADSNNGAGFLYVTNLKSGSEQISFSQSGGGGGEASFIRVIAWEISGTFNSVDTVNCTNNNGNGGSIMQNGCTDQNFAQGDFLVTVYGGSTSASSINQIQNNRLFNSSISSPMCILLGTPQWAGGNDLEQVTLNANAYWSGVTIGFSGFQSATIFETAWNIPSASGLAASTIFLLFMLIPVAGIELILIKMKSKESYVLFLTLGLLIGSVLGIIANVVPLSILLVTGTIFAVYLWRGRNSNANNF